MTAPLPINSKIWDISSKGICVLVKEDSNLLNYLKVGSVSELKYYTNNTYKPIEYLKTKDQAYHER